MSDSSPVSESDVVAVGKPSAWRQVRSRRLAALVLDVLVLCPEHCGDMAGGTNSVAVFGSRVRMAREAREWTQEELADRSGLTSVQISRVERGTREPRLTTLLRLIAALDVKPDKLLGGL